MAAATWELGRPQMRLADEHLFDFGLETRVKKKILEPNLIFQRRLSPTVHKISPNQGIRPEGNTPFLERDMYR